MYAIVGILTGMNISVLSDSVWRRVVAEIPSGPAAIFLYLVLVVCGVVIWRAHRGQEKE